MLQDYLNWIVIFHNPINSSRRTKCHRCNVSYEGTVLYVPREGTAYTTYLPKEYICGNCVYDVEREYFRYKLPDEELPLWMGHKWLGTEVWCWYKERLHTLLTGELPRGYKKGMTHDTHTKTQTHASRVDGQL